eukprot:GFUD01008114.1.p1 GENE.GFUD01008114.1~~GFUD01008114.1.p1  ORF type:complete len:297 (-),score=69.31 GFUD01008114.1:121-1011(-)
MNGNFIITGAAMGFGKEFSRRVLATGGKVVLADKNVEKGKETCKEFQEEFGTLSCLFQEIDVTKKEDWETLWTISEEFLQNQIDVLVNNAGVSPLIGFDLCMKINLEGVLHGCNIFEEKLGLHNGGPGGLVVNTASMAGILYGMDRKSLAYQISKHGVVAATRSFGSEKVLRKTGIKHMALCPWFAETAILDGFNKEIIQKKLPWDFLSVERVGEAFQQTVTDQRSGSLMVVMPKAPLMYFPDVSLTVGTVVFLLSKLAQLSGAKTVYPNMLGLMLCIFVALVFYFFHLILSFCGL